jgi:citrate synthase
MSMSDETTNEHEKLPADETTAAQAPVVEGAEGTADDFEDDGTPAELADPFGGDENAKPIEVAIADESPVVGESHWYILKVQSNREDSIREALLRRISMQGMDKWFGEVIVPKEQVTEFKSGKKRVVSRKLYPNVDFYSGIVQSALGIPVSLFTGIFAMARTVGWIAQWNEMISDPEQKIGRPRQLFVGSPQRDVAPLAKR